MSVQEIIGGILAVFGAAIFVGAALGLYRFRDPYMRNAAVGAAAGLGLAFVTIGSAIVHPSRSAIVLAIIAVVLQLITSAIGAMLVGRAAVNSNHQFSDDTDTSALGLIREIGEDPRADVSEAEAAEQLAAAETDGGEMAGGEMADEEVHGGKANGGETAEGTGAGRDR